MEIEQNEQNEAFSTFSVQRFSICLMKFCAEKQALSVHISPSCIIVLLSFRFEKLKPMYCVFILNFLFPVNGLKFAPLNDRLRSGGGVLSKP